MVGMVAVAYATLGQRWLQVRKPTVVFSTSAHRQIQTSILRVFAEIGPTLVVVVVVVNLCFTSLFGTKGLLSDIVIR